MSEPHLHRSKLIEKSLNRGEFKHAADLIRQKLQDEPQSADCFYFFGVLHHYQNRLGQAIKNFKKALEIDPRHTDAAICLSVLYNDIGKFDEARNVFQQANQSVVGSRAENDLGIDRKFAVKHLEIADLYFRYRRYDEAIEEYTKAALLDPTALEIRIRRAKAFAKKGYTSRAIEELQQLKAQKPDFIPARIQLGVLYFSQGASLDAEIEWEGVLDIDPNNKEARSFCEMLKGRGSQISH